MSDLRYVEWRIRGSPFFTTLGQRKGRLRINGSLRSYPWKVKIFQLAATLFLFLLPMGFSFIAIFIQMSNPRKLSAVEKWFEKNFSHSTSDLLYSSFSFNNLYNYFTLSHSSLSQCHLILLEDAKNFSIKKANPERNMSLIQKKNYRINTIKSQFIRFNLCWKMWFVTLKAKKQIIWTPEALSLSRIL